MLYIEMLSTLMFFDLNQVGFTLTTKVCLANDMNAKP